MLPEMQCISMSRIALLNYEYGSGAGGGGVFTASLADGLEARGHDVELVVDEREQSTGSLAKMLSYPVRSLPAATRAAGDADILNAHFAIPTAAGLPAVSTMFDTPLVVNCMGADVYDPTRYGSIRPLLDALVNQWVGRAADTLIVPSEDMRDRLPGGLQSKTETIPYFVDASSYRPGDPRPSEPPRLLTVCRLVERKQLDLGLAALREVHDRGRDVRWTIVGSGPEADYLKHEARRLEIEDKVTFAGYIDESDLPLVYRLHDAFVLPSSHEAFGIAVVEALASGLPAVVTDTGGHAEVVGDAGRSVTESANALADGMLDVLDELPRLGHRARSRAEEQYTTSAVLPQYEQLYQRVS